MLNFKDPPNDILSPRSPKGGVIGHSTRYNANNNEIAADHMIGDIEEEADKEEEDADKDERSLNASSRPKSKVSDYQEARPTSSHLQEVTPEVFTSIVPAVD